MVKQRLEPGPPTSDFHILSTGLSQFHWQKCLRSYEYTLKLCIQVYMIHIQGQLVECFFCTRRQFIAASYIMKRTHTVNKLKFNTGRNLMFEATTKGAFHHMQTQQKIAVGHNNTCIHCGRTCGASNTYFLMCNTHDGSQRLDYIESSWTSMIFIIKKQNRKCKGEKIL